MNDQHPEVSAVLQRYAERPATDLYSMLRPEVCAAMQERQREILRFLRSDPGFCHVANVSLVEVGCGTGSNLLEFLRLGFRPDNLVGIELIPERVARARETLPCRVRIQECDAARAAISTQSVDIVYQSLVFSSILDDAYQAGLARQMWSWVRPGGVVLWYDFLYDNPANRNVRGVSVTRVRKLFPEAMMVARRVTLAPPISRRVCRLHPAAYACLNVFPFLRSHVLCWLKKPDGSES